MLIKHSKKFWTTILKMLNKYLKKNVDHVYKNVEQSVWKTIKHVYKNVNRKTPHHAVENDLGLVPWFDCSMIFHLPKKFIS